MKNAKRLITLLLMLTMISGVFPSALASEYDTADADCIDFLTSLDIMQNDSEGEFGSDRLFTRGEFASLLCDIIGIVPDEIEDDIPLYADLTSNCKCAPYVIPMIEGGYMTLDAEGKFWPNAPVSLEDALRAFVILQGGKILLDNYTPVEVANRVGILDGITVSSSELTKGQVALLLYETLHTEYYQQTVYGSTQEYEQDADYLVLENLYGIVYGKGVVTGENGTDFMDVNDNLTEGRIMIDKVIYEGKLNDKYLGYTVNYYYTKSGEDKKIRELVYIAKDSDENEVITIASDMIKSVSETELVYWTDESASKTKTVKLPGSLDFVYNGVANPAWSSKDFVFDHGYVTLINNDGDGKYDVVMVDSYDFIIVGYSDTVNRRIYDQYTANVLDLSDPSIKYSIYQKDGKKVSFERGLKVNRLLAVKESKNTDGTKIMEITQLDTPISGDIEMISDKSITIGGNELQISDALYHSLDDGMLKLGRRVAAYIWDDEVVRLEIPDSTGERPNAAYLVDVGKTASGLDAGIMFRIARQSAAFEDFNGAAKITIDGVPYRDSDDIRTYLANTAKLSYYSADFPYAQPVQVWVNSKNEVYKIDTLTYKAAYEEEAETMVSKVSVESMRYSVPNRSMYVSGKLKFTVPASSTVYWIPINKRYDEDFYGKVIGGGFGANSYTVEALFVQENFEAEAVYVYYYPISTVAGNTSPVIIERFTKSLNDDGDEVTKLYYMTMTGISGSILLPKNLRTPELHVGDVVRWRSNYAGNPTVMECIFSPYTVPDKNNRLRSFYTTGSEDAGAIQRGTASVYGTVLYRKNGLITLTTSIASDSEGVEAMENLDNFFTDSNTRYIRIEKEREQPVVTLKDFSALREYGSNPSEASEVYIFILGNSIRVVYEIAL
ncbi:MAG: S-layer homology domain-containing protein [Clostridia bacterium]|nr:S-layer homology domain-containing protein [Clostridia bacterium]